jgi:hypothetical protein
MSGTQGTSTQWPQILRDAVYLCWWYTGSKTHKDKDAIEGIVQFYKAKESIKLTNMYVGTDVSRLQLPAGRQVSATWHVKNSILVVLRLLEEGDEGCGSKSSNRRGNGRTGPDATTNFTLHTIDWYLTMGCGNWTHWPLPGDIITASRFGHLKAATAYHAFAYVSQHYDLWRLAYGSHLYNAIWKEFYSGIGDEFAT